MTYGDSGQEALLSHLRSYSAPSFCGECVGAMGSLLALMLLTPAGPVSPHLLGEIFLVLALLLGNASVMGDCCVDSCLTDRHAGESVSPSALALSSGHAPCGNPPPTASRR